MKNPLDIVKGTITTWIVITVVLVLIVVLAF